MGLENHHIRGSPLGEELRAPAWGSGPTAPGPRGVATGPEGRPRGLPAGAPAVGVRPRRGPRDLTVPLHQQMDKETGALG